MVVRERVLDPRGVARDAAAMSIDGTVAARLKRLNLIMGVVHLVQALAIIALSTDFALPLTTSFLTFDEATSALVPATETQTTLRIGWLVASFSLLSAAAHLTVATVWFESYKGYLARGFNPARWVEYALSSSVMMVVIAMLVGIYDVTALILIFGLNAMMILFGWMMDLLNEGRDRVRWMPFWFGSVAGAIPWVAVAVYLFGGGPPTFVYFIYVSIFATFNVFAIVMVLRYRARGGWADPLRAERAFIWLSLTAKSLLAWQVFAGTLRPV